MAPIPASSSAAFFAGLTAASGFDAMLGNERYVRVPDDWVLAVADVAGSTEAIGAGRYKDVNFAGAAVICAIQNSLGCRALPFAFGGDGAIVALSGQEADRGAGALASVRRWSTDAIGLDLRAALVPVRDARAAGHEVRLARQSAGDVGYAMFDGGGARWAESELKAGRYGVAPAAAGSEPDLTGLSCRWAPVPAAHGVILSVIAEPAPGAGRDAFERVAASLVALLREQDGEGHPLPLQGPAPSRIVKGVRLERAAGGSLRRRIVEESALRASHALGRSVGGFDGGAYRAAVTRNSDFRKFDDGLKLTVDVPAGVAARLEALLERAAAAGDCRFGVHRQAEALLTCIVPSAKEHDHVHFIDGAGGGYALAAAQLKSRS